MVKRLAIVCLILLTIAALSVPAVGASLVPMSWGFPVMIQNRLSRAFNRRMRLTAT